MANNLVPGGARPGLFTTRRSRLVRIEKLVLHDLPLEPGQVRPLQEELWQGTLFMMDGKTVDTIKYWQNDGALASMNGVATPDDLAILVREEPSESNVVQIGSGDAADILNKAQDVRKGFHPTAA